MAKKVIHPTSARLSPTAKEVLDALKKDGPYGKDRSESYVIEQALLEAGKRYNVKTTIPID